MKKNLQTEQTALIICAMLSKIVQNYSKRESLTFGWFIVEWVCSFIFGFLHLWVVSVQVYFGQTDAFFHKYYINFRIIFAVEAGEKILQQAYNNKIDEYCEK